jgi:hypothetical protein
MVLNVFFDVLNSGEVKNCAEKDGLAPDLLLPVRDGAGRLPRMAGIERRQNSYTAFSRPQDLDMKNQGLG